MGNIDILDNIVSYLVALGSFVTVAGVLFLHSRTKNRMVAGKLKTIRWLQCFCSPQFYKNITIVTMKQDKIHLDKIGEARKRLEELATNDLAPVLDPLQQFKGGYLYNHGIPGSRKSDQDWEIRLSHGKKIVEQSTEIKKLILDRYDQYPKIKLRLQKRLRAKRHQRRQKLQRHFKETYSRRRCISARTGQLFSGQMSRAMKTRVCRVKRQQKVANQNFIISDCLNLLGNRFAQLKLWQLSSSRLS